MSDKAKFATLAKEWTQHCNRVWYSSRMADYLEHSAYREIVKLGWAAVPWIMERYQHDDLPWGFALQEITGLQMIHNIHDFDPLEVKRKWLSWSKT